jgi:hypothetical protein
MNGRHAPISTDVLAECDVRISLIVVAPWHESGACLPYDKGSQRPMSAAKGYPILAAGPAYVCSMPRSM